MVALAGISLQNLKKRRSYILLFLLILTGNSTPLATTIPCWRPFWRDSSASLYSSLCQSSRQEDSMKPSSSLEQSQCENHQLELNRRLMLEKFELQLISGINVHARLNAFLQFTLMRTNSWDLSFRIYDNKVIALSASFDFFFSSGLALFLSALATDVWSFLGCRWLLAFRSCQYGPGRALLTKSVGKDEMAKVGRQSYFCNIFNLSQCILEWCISQSYSYIIILQYVIEVPENIYTKLCLQT